MSQGQVTYQMQYAASAPLVVRSPEQGRGDFVVRLHPDAEGPARDRSGRAFHIVPEGYGEHAPLARVVTEQTLARPGGRPAVYRVEDPYGTPIGRITLRRRPFGFGRRTRWTVEPVTGPALRGYRGRLVWWVLWWPFGLPLSLTWAITSIFADDGDGGFRSPRRVIWRDGSGRAHVVFRGMAEDYRVLTGGWDPRLITALVGLHQSFDPNEAAPTGGWHKG
ncbi:hypothetical protein [Streptomyces sp. MMG1533]|uniref:hypothetical protein n=1 Tax=Streptomyces sp. MMG1533 TaxID=1415546 RepID=UPI000A47B7EE|nr:hypothetical protein [Streptomyces sp. MMG1533]